MAKRDPRIGLYGLSADDLETADRLGMSPWDFSVAYLGNGQSYGEMKPEEKREAWKVLFAERLTEQADKLTVWMDGDGVLWLGWFRRHFTGANHIIIVGRLSLEQQTIVAVPMRRESDDVAWCRPWAGFGSKVWDVLKTWRRIVPPGVF